LTDLLKSIAPQFLYILRLIENLSIDVQDLKFARLNLDLMLDDSII